jgi:N-acetylglucosaminyldiphosphoundecaprenol N-acetyl-beta-D-mannosaminyltransferase
MANNLTKNKLLFKGIIFHNFKKINFKKLLYKKKLIFFPAAPALAEIEKFPRYHKSLKKADYVFFDSGYFVLLLRFLKNIKVKKFSGYKFLSLLFNYLKKNKLMSILLIDPNKKESVSNQKLMKEIGLKNYNSYIAPKYNKSKISDTKLLKLIKIKKPKVIIINIGGGIQELLGLYLKKNTNIDCSIICTGAAIAFFTKNQAPINNLIDSLYLGWIVRILFNPKIFFMRYIKALELFKMLYKEEVILYGKK